VPEGEDSSPEGEDSSLSVATASRLPAFAIGITKRPKANRKKASENDAIQKETVAQEDAPKRRRASLVPVPSLVNNAKSPQRNCQQSHRGTTQRFKDKNTIMLLQH